MKQNNIIEQLLKQAENQRLEFQARIRKDSIGKTVCALLNCKGGQIIVGIEGKGQVNGIKDAGNNKNIIAKHLKEQIIPEAPIKVSIEKYKDKQLLLIETWAGSKQPYTYKGTIYYRRNDKTSPAAPQEISFLINERQKAETHWERQPALGVELEDLDLVEIEKTMQEPLDLKEMVIDQKEDPYKVREIIAKYEKEQFHVKSNLLEFLSRYGLYLNGQFTNAAVVLFAYQPAKFIPQSRIRLSFLKESKTDDVFLDDKLLEGNLFKNIEAIQSFFEKHLAVVRKFGTNGWKREDDFIFPIKGLREGVLNALIHRDYSSVSGSAAIILYPDKLEICNTGKSPLKSAELTKPHLSLPFNPDIAHIVFLRGYIEKIGRGTLKIIESCEQAGLKKPVWKMRENSVTLTFYGDISHSIPINKRSEGTTEGTAEGTTEGVVEGFIEGAIEGVSRELKDRLAILLKAIYTKEGHRMPQFKEWTNFSKSSVERYIKMLKEAGFIEFRGEVLHTGGYYLTDTFKKKLKGEGKRSLELRKGQRAKS